MLRVAPPGEAGAAPRMSGTLCGPASLVKTASAPTLSFVRRITIVVMRCAWRPAKGPDDATCSSGECQMTDVPETRWARTVDGACIAYQDVGQGAVTLLVVHGWVSHLEVYWEQPLYVRFLRRLSRTMRVLVFDKRGIGHVRPRATERRTSASCSTTFGRCWTQPASRRPHCSAGADRGRSSPRSSPRPTPSAPCAWPWPARSTERREPDYPWGESPQEFEERLARDLRGVGQRGRSRRLRAQSAYRGLDPRLSPPYSDPEIPEVEREARPLRGHAGELRAVLAHVVRAPTCVPRCARSRRRPPASSPRTTQSDAGLARLQAGVDPGARAVPVATTVEVIWVPEPEPMVAAIEGFIASVRQEEAELDRMLATVLFTDIVDSTDRACAAG